MDQHPLNLLLRFLLELAALAAFALWGWLQSDGWTRYLLAAGLPVLASAVWGVFRVPDDPGRAPVAVPGPVRLLIEAVFFGAATLALSGTGRPATAIIFAGATVLQYLTSLARLRRILRS